jgi:hypothetical protein
VQGLCLHDWGLSHVPLMLCTDAAVYLEPAVLGGVFRDKSCACAGHAPAFILLTYLL